MRFPGECIAAGAACLALLSCRQAGQDQDANSIQQNAAQTSVLPVAEPPLDREALLIAAIRAASAHAAGADDGAAQRQLDGKRFEVRIRFGCAGGQDAEELRGWRFDETSRTLRLRIRNDIFANDPVVARVAGKNFETVEGLWLRRPWLLAAACPRTPEARTAEPAAVEQVESESEPAAETATGDEAASQARRVGIAQFYTAADPRTGQRRQRPYEATIVLDEGQAPSPQGYDFIISGRLRALPDRRVIACTATSAEAAPACIISVRIDHASIERPDNGERLAEWHDG